jgi:hypothetical protein
MNMDKDQYSSICFA